MPRHPARGGQRPGDPRDLPPAAHRHHDGLAAGQILVDLETGRAVPGDHRRRVEGVQECQPVLLGQTPRLAKGVGRRPVQHDLGTVAPGCRHLGGRRLLRHHHDRAGGGSCGRPRHGLRMIPGRNRHHPAPPLPVAETGDGVERATNLERPRPLQAFALQPHGSADPVAQRAKRQKRRAVKHRRHTLSGVFEVLLVKPDLHALSPGLVRHRRLSLPPQVRSLGQTAPRAKAPIWAGATECRVADPPQATPNTRIDPHENPITV